MRSAGMGLLSNCVRWDSYKGCLRTKRSIVSMLTAIILMAALTLNAGAAMIKRDDLATVVVTVKAGDSLWKIARKTCPGQNPVEVIKLMRNMNTLGKYIHPGDRLVVPKYTRVATTKRPSRGNTTGQVLTCEATAYCYTGNRTATMTWPTEGRTIAVDPEVIPLGSKVNVRCESRPEANGVYTAEDTGGVIKGNIIDIYMNDRSQAIQWGRRDVEITVLE